MSEQNMEIASATETKPESAGSMLVNIFLEPSRVFKSIKIKSSWVLPFIIYLIIATIGAYFTTPFQMEIGKQKIMQSDQLTEEQKQAQIEMSGKFAFLGWVIAPIAVVVIMLLITGANLLVGSVILGGTTRFTTMWSAICFTSLISALGLIIKVPLMLWKHTADIRTSLAILLPGKDLASGIVSFLNTSTDLFLIWQIVVMIVGMAIIYNFSKLRASLVVLIPTAIIFGIMGLIQLAF